MKTISKSSIVNLPKKVGMEVKGRWIRVSGPRGTLYKTFNHTKLTITEVNRKQFKVTVYFGNKKQNQCVNTVCSTISNMIKGVTKGFRYIMRLVYAHYPINLFISPDGRLVEIRNYIGQKLVRKVSVPKDVKVYQTKVKDELIVEGNNLDNVSKVSSQINQSARVRDRDIRMFLDGIYVLQKTTIDP